MGACTPKRIGVAADTVAAAAKIAKAEAAPTVSLQIMMALPLLIIDEHEGGHASLDLV
jgi:hypothetical protein